MTEEQALEIKRRIGKIPRYPMSLHLRNPSGDYSVYWDDILFTNQEEYKLLNLMLLDMEKQLKKVRWCHGPSEILGWIRDLSGKSDKMLLRFAPGIYAWLRRDIEEDEK